MILLISQQIVREKDRGAQGVETWEDSESKPLGGSVLHMSEKQDLLSV